MSYEMESNQVNERLAQLRALMREQDISIYIVPTADDHASEYIGEHYKSRKFITGFTGSAGTAVITPEEAGLWTDGRYFVQAAKQIADSEVKLFPMGEPDVPTVREYVKAHLPEGGNIGFDGTCMVAKDSEAYEKIAKGKGGCIKASKDLIGVLWEERPALISAPVWVLEQQYAGVSTSRKLSDIRKKMQEQECDCHLVTGLYDIAWITNMRGDDISHVPVFLSFLLLTQEKNLLYSFYENWSEQVMDYLFQEGIEVRPYGQIYEDLGVMVAGSKGILLDKTSVNAKLMEQLPKDLKVVDEANPSQLMRAIKNPVEIANTIEAHIHDGVAVTRFIYELKQQGGREHMTELTAADYLQELRQEQPGYLDLSFDTICAYGANAAMMHYSATPEDYSVLEPEGFLLVDSGGQYLGGTTDITRTIVLGPLTDEMKLMYTKVLQGHLRLSHAKFPKGATGQNLDVLARQPLWAMGLDYRCGTGHGVGHLLNVHEGPNAFRWRMLEGQKPQPIVPGMITTNEPGFYQEDGFGIRIENELLCVEGEKTEYGQFYELQNLTFAPIDLDAVIPELLSEEERGWLNEYHQQVFDKISPYLNEEEKEWLQYETRAI